MPIKATYEIVEECRRRLLSHYGSRLQGVVLYGSEARGEALPESDIDLLVLLSPPLDYFRELDVIIDLLFDVQLDAERYISARPASSVEYEAGAVQLYRNARREGIVVPAYE